MSGVKGVRDFNRKMQKNVKKQIECFTFAITNDNGKRVMQTVVNGNIVESYDI